MGSLLTLLLAVHLTSVEIDGPDVRPPFEDLARLPTVEKLAEMWKENRAYAARLQARLDFCDYWLGCKQALAETDWLGDWVQLALRAQHYVVVQIENEDDGTSYVLTVVQWDEGDEPRNCLERLREYVGDEAYERGWWPPAVPHWPGKLN